MCRPCNSFQIILNRKVNKKLKFQYGENSSLVFHDVNIQSENVIFLKNYLRFVFLNKIILVMISR